MCIYRVEATIHGNSLDTGNGEEGRVKNGFNVLKLSGDKGL